MSEFLDEQWRKMLKALHAHDNEIYESKKGVKKMFKTFYRVTLKDELFIEPDAPQEVVKIFKQLDKDYLLPPFNK